jgi:hypothetical protein
MPEPGQLGEIVGDELKVVVHLFPDKQSQGMLRSM